MNETPDRLTIGALAAQSRLSRETIRYYERVGLIRPSARSEGGYRLYAPGAVDRLRFIRTLRELGFTLNEIDRLLGIVDRDAGRCADIGDFIRDKRAAVERQIERLTRLKELLLDLEARCPHVEALFACPIIDRLADERWMADAEGGERRD